jgi:hypothetical protein
MGARLLSAGYEPENEGTLLEVEAWRDAAIEVIRQSPSVDYLHGTGRDEDIEFVLAHVDDIPEVAVYNGQQVSLLSSSGFGEVAAGLPT